MLSLFSPSKANLFLQVRGKRLDGYHELASLFQALSLGDTLAFELGEEDYIELISANSLNLPLNQSNLILKAADLFRRITGYKFGLRVVLDKKIPLQAGLGGGSSNAATTLWAINKLVKSPLSSFELIELSKELGSDVTFFFSEGTAFCTGRGEIVEKLPFLKINKPFYIVKPIQGLSTPVVFKEYKKSDSLLIDPDTVVKDFYNGNFLFFNDLEKPAFRIDPSMKRTKDYLESLGFECVVMSGSGTSFLCMGQPNTTIDSSLAHYPVKFISRKIDEWYDQSDD